jgi:hypothetical protein
MRKLRKLLDAVDRQLSAFDVDEESPAHPQDDGKHLQQIVLHLLAFTQVIFHSI